MSSGVNDFGPSGVEAPSPSPPILVSEDLPVSPSEDVRSYGNLIKKMVARLNISTSQSTPVVDDFVFDMIQAQTSAAVAIPMSKVLLQSIKAFWEKPASLPMSNKRLDQMYHTQEQGAEFLFKHPQTNSVIVSSLSKSHHHHSTHTPRIRRGRN